MDQIEQQTDNLKDQLMELLVSNREILEEFKSENQNKTPEPDSSSEESPRADNSGSSSMDQS